MTDVTGPDAQPQITPPFRVDAPGFYEMSADDYHRDPCPEPSLRASTAWRLCNDSAARAWWNHPRLNPDFQREEEEQFDIGTAAHLIVLEGQFAKVRVVEAPDWRTKAAQEARALIRATGNLPILRKTWDHVIGMTKRTREQLDAHVDGKAMFTGGQPELVAVWLEDVHGRRIWCRSRIDYYRAGKGLDDYKTTRVSANPEAVSRTMAKNGQAMQAVFYQRGVEALTGQRLPFRFAVQECFAPYLLSVMALAPSLEMLAEKQRRYALEAWARCLERDSWPGYSRLTAYADLPPWVEQEWLDRELREEVAGAV